MAGSSVPNSRVAGMPALLDLSVRPKAGLGMHQMRPKMEKIEPSIHYAPAKVAKTKRLPNVGTKMRQKHGIGHMKAKFHPE